MRTAVAEEFFGGRAGIVKALPNWTKAAVYKWGDTVPLIAAMELERVSHRKVRVDMTLYKKKPGHASARTAA